MKYKAYAIETIFSESGYRMGYKIGVEGNPKLLLGEEVIEMIDCDDADMFIDLVGKLSKKYNCK